MLYIQQQYSILFDIAATTSTLWRRHDVYDIYLKHFVHILYNLRAFYSKGKTNKKTNKNKFAIWNKKLHYQFPLIPLFQIKLGRTVVAINSIFNIMLIWLNYLIWIYPSISFFLCTFIKFTCLPVNKFIQTPSSFESLIPSQNLQLNLFCTLILCLSWVQSNKNAFYHLFAQPELGVVWCWKFGRANII